MSAKSTADHGATFENSDLVASFLQGIIVEYDSYKLQRSDPREPVSIPVEAVQLDENFEMISEPFHMVTRDISCSGVGLF